MNRKMILMKELIEEISMGPFGSNIKIDNFVKDGVPVLNGANIAGIKLIEKSFNYLTPEKAKSLKKANAKRGDIVITHRGTLGQICYIPNDSKFDNYVISQSQFRVTLKTDLVCPEYFVYYFHTKEGQKRLLANKSYVGVPALAQATTNFKIIDFPLIDIVIQKKIASILSTLDKKIELNNQINQKLEAMAKTLYDYWFVQFDFPDSDGKPYKSSGGTMVYSEELKREIPEGWEVDIVGNILGKIDRKIQITSKEILPIGKIPVIDQGKDYICGFTNDENSLLSTRSNPFIIFGDHTRVLKFINFDFARGADGTQILLSNNRRMPQHLFFYVLKSIDLSNYGYARHFKFLKERKILLSNEEVANKFNLLVTSFYKKINNNTKENQKLTQLRDWLLPMLMNGQVRVDGGLNV